MELRIAHLYPEVLNLYGDRGNIRCMTRRLEWRGIGCTVDELGIGAVHTGPAGRSAIIPSGSERSPAAALSRDLRTTAG